MTPTLLTILQPDAVKALYCSERETSLQSKTCKTFLCNEVSL